jgi:hypothetical protein
MKGLVQVFDVRSFHSIKTIRNTSNTGLFAASSEIFAFPEDKDPGSIVLVSTLDFETMRIMKGCHHTALQLVSASDSFPGILTVGQEGTVIRHFDTDKFELVSEYRRGYTHSAVVCMAGTKDLKVVCSPTTIHVFDHEGNHMKIPPKAVPIECWVKDRLVFIVGRDGRMAVYEIPMGKRIGELKGEYHLMSGAVIKRARRTTH